MDIRDQNDLIFALQRIAFDSRDTMGNKTVERYRSIAKNALLNIGIEKPKTFCKICSHEIPNEEHDIIYFCDKCQEECDPYNKNKK